MARGGLRVVIVGAGLGGIAAAIELRRHGFDDIRILEKAPAPGGTWFYNRYPKCACDVPSHLYSFSFAQRRDWSRVCSPQEEILRYLERVARDHEVDRLVVPNTEVIACNWDDGACRWTVESANGGSWQAEAVILATGQLHQPAVPRIEDQEQFRGHSFHSARWDHDYDLAGKRVAVIGTGASAVQFIPRKNRPYPAFVKSLVKRVPGLQSYRRRFVYNYGESLTLMIRHPRTLGR